ncbi:hypothetical protein UB33_21320 [Photobacterium angustum]|nr:hypothetical protein UB33_21320 [Photobacterium angustum]
MPVSRLNENNVLMGNFPLKKEKDHQMSKDGINMYKRKVKISIDDCGEMLVTRYIIPRRTNANGIINIAVPFAKVTA